MASTKLAPSKRVRNTQIVSAIALIVGGLVLNIIGFTAYSKTYGRGLESSAASLFVIIVYCTSGGWYIKQGIVGLLAAVTRNRCATILDVVFTIVCLLGQLVLMSLTFVWFNAIAETPCCPTDHSLVMELSNMTYAATFFQVATFVFLTVSLVAIIMTLRSKSPFDYGTLQANPGYIVQQEGGLAMAPTSSAPVADWQTQQTPEPASHTGYGYSTLQSSPAYEKQHEGSFGIAAASSASVADWETPEPAFQSGYGYSTLRRHPTDAKQDEDFASTSVADWHTQETPEPASQPGYLDPEAPPPNYACFDPPASIDA